jgi:hypothetical protein
LGDAQAFLGARGLRRSESPRLPERAVTTTASATLPVRDEPKQIAEVAKPRAWPVWAYAAAAVLMLSSVGMVAQRFQSTTATLPPSTTRLFTSDREVSLSIDGTDARILSGCTDGCELLEQRSDNEWSSVGRFEPAGTLRLGSAVGSTRLGVRMKDQSSVRALVRE